MLPAKSLMEKLAKVFIGKIKITGHSNIQSNGSQILFAIILPRLPMG